MLFANTNRFSEHNLPHSPPGALYDSIISSQEHFVIIFSSRVDLDHISANSSSLAWLALTRFHI